MVKNFAVVSLHSLCLQVLTNPTANLGTLPGTAACSEIELHFLGQLVSSQGHQRQDRSGGYKSPCTMVGLG